MLARGCLGVVVVAATVVACSGGGGRAARTEEAGLVLQADGDDVIVTDPRGGVELRFPGRPRITESHLPWVGSTRRAVTVERVDQGVERDFMVIELDGADLDAADRTKGYDGAQAGGLRAGGATLLDQADTELLGTPARRFHGGLVDGREVWGWVALVPESRALYEVIVVARAGRGEVAARFAAGLHAADPASLPERTLDGVRVDFAGGAWRARDEATGWGVRFAARPFLDERGVDLPNGHVANQIIASSQGGDGAATFAVGRYASIDVAGRTPSEILDGAAAMAAKMAGGAVLINEEITVAGLPGRRLVMSGRDVRSEMHMEMRVVYDAPARTLLMFGGADRVGDTIMPARIDALVASFARAPR